MISKTVSYKKACIADSIIIGNVWKYMEVDFPECGTYGLQNFASSHNEFKIISKTITEFTGFTSKEAKGNANLHVHLFIRNIMTHSASALFYKKSRDPFSRQNFVKDASFQP